MDPYLRILRPLNGAMAGLAVVGGAYVASGGVGWEALLASGAAFFICGAGNVINDYFDVDIDRVNAPSRPIPSGAIAPSSARLYALFLFALGALAAAPISPFVLAIALLNSLLLYLYAWRIKRRGGLLKGLTVSYLVASPFFFGGAAVGHPLPTLLLSLLAGLANVGREVVKDIEDYEGDRPYARTLPRQLGIGGAAWVAAVFVALAVALSPLPYLLGLLGIRYLAVVLLADMLFVYAMADFLLEAAPARATGCQRRIKGAMLLALAAFFVGA
ncbi:MAG: geranylgeranylglycerol-phosphate geranylgeranyltransferase [Candidatus Hydrothermarchaeota archaeon]